MNFTWEIHKAGNIIDSNTAICSGHVISEETNPDYIVENCLQSIIKQYPKQNLLIRYRKNSTALYAIEHWIV